MFFGYAGYARDFIGSFQHFCHHRRSFFLKIFEGVQTSIGSMRRGTVIALEIVFHHEFPVSVNAITVPMSNLGVRKIVGAQRLLDVVE